MNSINSIYINIELLFIYNSTNLELLLNCFQIIRRNNTRFHGIEFLFIPLFYYLYFIELIKVQICQSNKF